MKLKSLILILLLTIGSIPFLSAQESPEPETNKTDDSWKFTVTPYLWMSSINGDLTVINQNIPVDLNFSEDVISNLKMAAMIHAEAKKNKLSFMLDIFYAKLGTGGQISGILNRTKNVKLRLKETMFEGGLGYTFAQTGGFSLDALIGLRYFNTNTNVKVNDAVIADKDINFLDPYVGVRFRNDWNKWAISGRADIGGFDMGSDHSYKINGLITYKFSESFATSVGYQIYQPDYKKDKFRYNIANEGFLIGFSFGF
jgi:hypothetical protein